MHLIIACFVSIFAAALNTNDQAQRTSVRPERAITIRIKTKDRVVIKGDLLLPTNVSKKYPRSGAVILVHGGDGERKDWWGLQKKISNWGAATLNIDLRGHGESILRGQSRARSGSRKHKGKNRTDAILKPFEEDIKSAVTYLRKHKNIDPNRISLIGIDLGAVAALRYAASDLGIKGVGVISPESPICSEFNLKKEAKNLSFRNLLILAPLSAKEVVEKTSQELAKSVRVLLVIANGEAKGVELFDIIKTTEPNRTVENELRFWLRDLGVLTPGP